MSNEEIVNNSMDEDELISFQLRARLSEIDFSLIWRVMSQSPNWSYKGNEYFLKGKNLGSAKNAMEQLDMFALQSLSFRNGDELMRGKEINEDLRSSRLDLLQKIFYFCKENDKPIPTHYFDVVPNPEELLSSPDSQTSHQKSQKVIGQRKKKTNVTNEPGTEQYFRTVNKKKQSEKSFVQISHDGSDKNAKLKWPSPNESVDAVQKMDFKSSYTSPKIDFQKNHEEWRFFIGTKHSLLLYGFGSKQSILNDFATKTLQSCGDVLILNGFDSSISVSSILDLFVDLFLSGVQPSSSTKSESFYNHDIGMIRPSPLFISKLVKRATAIGKAVGSRCTKPIYLVIHNIEGSGLRDPDSLKALAALILNSDVNDGMKKHEKNSYCNRVVQLVASIDHVDAVSFLDMEAMTNLSWIWKRIDTCDPYYSEVKQAFSHDARKMKATQKQVLDYVFMKKVLDSIAPKHTDILKALGNLQISKGKEDNSSGGFAYVDYNEWRSQCFKTLMIVSKEAEFISMVNELRDHSMVRLKHDGVLKKDFVCIPASNKKVVEIMKSLDK